MERIAFKMLLKPGNAEENCRRHDAIWPELVALLKAAGISDYSIWFDPETNTLFATLIRSTDHGIDRLPAEPVMRRWSEYAALVGVYGGHHGDQPGRVARDSAARAHVPLALT
jgi:L-rhamnose mutarotase